MVGEAQNHDQIMAEARQSLLDQRMGGRRHQAPIGRGSAQLRQQNLMTRIKLIGGSLLAIVLAAMVTGIAIDGIGPAEDWRAYGRTADAKRRAASAWAKASA